MDREKVIKGLEICRHRVISQENCMECPYIYDGRSKQTNCEGVLHWDALTLIKEQEHKDRMFHALEDDWKRLKELLKEQGAVEPYSMNAERTYGICPKCGKIIFRYGNVEENHYCGVCGQVVKWE